MRNDIEQDLRELFERKAREASTAPRPPEGVIRRGRRRQVGTALVTGATVIAVIAGSVVGLGAIRRGSGPQPAVESDRNEVFERTATIENFTITSPSDWFLVNQWPLGLSLATSSAGSTRCEISVGPDGQTQEESCTEESGSSPIPTPGGLPLFQLSNEDLGLASSFCAGPGGSLEPDGAVLEVTLDFDATRSGPEASAPTSAPLAPFDEAAGPQPDGPCGPGFYARFSEGSVPFLAYARVGPEASDEDRRTLFDAFAGMSVAPWKWQGAASETPAYVLAGGENAAGPWRLEVGRPPTSDRSGSNVDLYVVSPNRVTGIPDFVLTTDAPIVQAGGDPVFGAVTKEAEAVELRLEDGTPPLPGTIVPLPPSLAFPFDLFFIEHEGDVPGRAVALRADGTVLDGALPTVVPIDDPLRRATVVIGSTTLGVDWRATFWGRFEDESACIGVRIGESLFYNNPLCPTLLRSSLAGDRPSVHSWISRSLSVHAGSVPPEVRAVQFASDDGSDSAHFAGCVDGPLGWELKRVCAIALPPEGSGELLYTDRDGSVLYREALAWGKASTGA